MQIWNLRGFNMNKKISAIAALGLMLFSVSSYARLYVSPSDGAAPATSSFAQSTSANPFALGFGTDIPLSMAVKQIIPDGCWKVNIDESLANQRVSWTGGRPWDEVLDRMAKDHGLVVSINKNECVIGVSKSQLTAPALASRTNKVWQLKSGESLRENLMAWASAAGWTLQWDLTIDYEIEHSATLVGEFAGADGVVSKVVTSFESAKSPLKATFYSGNKVIRITDGGYTQGGVQ